MTPSFFGAHIILEQFSSTLEKYLTTFEKLNPIETRNPAYGVII
jgi:hypothetical protein